MRANITVSLGHIEEMRAFRVLDELHKHECEGFRDAQSRRIGLNHRGDGCDEFGTGQRHQQPGFVVYGFDEVRHALVPLGFLFQTRERRRGEGRGTFRFDGGAERGDP